MTTFLLLKVSRFMRSSGNDYKTENPFNILSYNLTVSLQWNDVVRRYVMSGGIDGSL